MDMLWVQVENHSRAPMVVHSEHSDQATGDAQFGPCAIGGMGMTDSDGRTLTAPFTVRVGPGSIQDGDPQPDFDSMPVVIDSNALSPPPGAAGYRVTIDADGSVSSLEPLDVFEEERVGEELC